MNEQNLTPFEKNTQKARECGKKGGEATAKIRKERKKLRETLDILLTMDNKETQKDNQTSIAIALLKEALGGNVKAFEVIRDTIGEKPTDKQIISGSGYTVMINRECVDVEHTEEE